MPFARSSVFIALISFPAAAYVVDAVTVRPATPAVVTVSDSIVRQPADAVVTFALAEVLQEQGDPPLGLQRDPPPTTAEPRRESRPPLIITAPAFRMPRAPALVGLDGIAEILANTADERDVLPVLVARSVVPVLSDAPATRSLIEATRPVGDSDLDRFYEVEGLEEPPELLSGAVARYPPLLASQGVEGFVDVRFAIESSGQTDSIQILFATDRRFEQPAREAIQRSRYRPGRIGGVLVRTMVEQRFTFGSASNDLAQQGALRAATPDDSAPVDQSRVYDPKDVDEPPELKTEATPRYPQILWDMRVDGFVDVEFVIGLSGQAERSSINITFASDWRFEQPATDAIRLSLYRPGLIRSASVRVRVKQRVTFTRQ